MSAGMAFVSGAVESNTVGVIINGVSAGLTAFQYWSNGGSFWGGLACGAVSFGASFISGNSLDSDLAKHMVNATFGAGAQYCAAAINAGVQRVASKRQGTVYSEPYNSKTARCAGKVYGTGRCSSGSSSGCSMNKNLMVAY